MTFKETDEDPTEVAKAFDRGPDGVTREPTAFENSVAAVNRRAVAEGDDYVVVWTHKQQDDLTFIKQYVDFEMMNREAFFWSSEGYKKKRVYFHGVV